MKQKLLILIAVITITGFNFSTRSQTGFNPIIEFCTGTWCPWCPCGHTIIHDILANYPNTMVLAYHGPSNDPWTSTGLPMIQYFGFNSYPTGIVSRNTGIMDRTAWNNRVVIQSFTFDPGVSIAVNNKNYNSGTRTITADVQITALVTLSGTYNVMFVLTENNLIYNQAGNGSCSGGSNYVHDHVVRGLINGTTGTLVNSANPWNQNTSYTVPLSYIIPAGVSEGNSSVNIFIYKTGGNPSTDQQVQQTKVISVTQPVGIHNNNEIATEYSLSQNYPNPFNPTTNIKFSIPKDENVSLKFYNAMGQEVATYVDGFLKAGVYNADFDGSMLSSGIYFYTLKTPSFSETKKMMLVK
ncbi:MAG: Omp28-related outer membrane protein [Ignavibacteria bacterium]|nr:Omp28-related outer membrane protein [Ignavibacteria bacterium]